MKTITELEIDRTTWACPENGFNEFSSRLLTGNNCKCCLGFLCLAKGVLAESILEKIMPKSVESCHTDTQLVLVKQARLIHSEFAKEAAFVNDQEELTQQERESRLIALFAREGITLTFTGKTKKEGA